MERLPTTLEGLVLLQPRVFHDERGFFLESFHRERYRELGITMEFVQDNHSRSVRGTIRALHYARPPGQGKLVRVAHGAIYDVAVDMRRASPTFGRYEAFELDDVNHRQLWIPAGFAHGFCALSETADVVYKVDHPYDPALEVGVAWDDPDIAIPWPTDAPVLSPRDRANPSFAEVAAGAPDW
jgi:dTDP-4-dehydrorhamnose 3,5-epimerase